MKQLYMIFIALAIACSVQAQQNMIIQAKAEAMHNNLVDISFSINGNDCVVGSNETLILRPLVESESGQSLELDPIYIMGSRRFIINQRLSKPITGNVLRYNDIKGKQYDYKKQIAYKPWMSNASVKIRQELEGCAGCGKLLNSTRVVTIDNIRRILDTNDIVNSVKLAYVTPEAEQIKNRSMKTVCFLDFELNKSKINPEYSHNSRELSKIQDMLSNLKNDNVISIKSIEIVGYASPEGNISGNKKLAELRAMALKDYIQKRCNLLMSNYKISFGGENWDGLKTAMENIENSYSQELLHLISSTDDKELLKAEIKQFDGGKLQSFLLSNVYPSLRTAVCEVDYEVKNYTDVNEAKIVLETKPQNLSLNEMYLIANSYDKGSNEFNDVFEVAVRMFPNDATANLNAAATALNKGDTLKAEKYLNRVKTRSYIPQADNSRGILCLLKGDKENALQYFESAAKAGVEEAKENATYVKKFK